MTSPTTPPFLTPRHEPPSQLWWTTSNGSVFLPTATPTSSYNVPYSESSHTTQSAPSSSLQPSNSNNPGPGLSFPSPYALSSGQVLSTFTTSYPVTVTQPSTTYISYSQTVVATPVFDSSADPSSVNSKSICVGDGLDSAAQGLLASLIIPSAIGLIIWVRS
jgi:hypothetical protein